MKKIYFENLDGLRFIAFLAIFIRHGFFTESPEVEQSTVFHTLDLLTKPTGLGVPFFFCLSGFLITYLLLAERAKHGRILIGKFYLRRILRIWPLYYTVVLFGFFVFPFVREMLIAEPYVETASLWKYLLFLGNFDQLGSGLPYGVGLGVTWSLAVEEQFYLFWPLLLTLVNYRYFLHTTLSLFVLSHVAMQFFGLPYTHSLGSVSDLSIGASLAIVAFNKEFYLEKAKNLSAAAITLIYLAGIAHIYMWTLTGFGIRVLVSLFMAFVIFEQCYCKNSLIKMGRFKKMSYLGTLTYGFYLLHTIANFIAFSLLSVAGIHIALPYLTAIVIQPLFSFGITLVMGYVSFKYLESPFLSLKSKFSTVHTGRDEPKQIQIEPNVSGPVRSSA